MVVYRYIWKYTWKLETCQHVERSTQGKVATAARSEQLLPYVGNYVPACEDVAIEAQPKCCAPQLPRQFGEGEHIVFAGDIVLKTLGLFLQQSTKDAESGGVSRQVPAVYRLVSVVNPERVRRRSHATHYVVSHITRIAPTATCSLDRKSVV